MGENVTEKENWRLTIELARAAHERDHAGIRQAYATVIEFAIFAMKTATTISGGAVVVGLAFVGALYSTEQDLAVRMMQPVVIFGIGAVLGGIASAFGYIAQYRYQEATRETSHHWDSPFVRATEKQKILQRKGIFWHIGCVVLLIGTYSCILGGIISAYMAISA